MLVLLVSASGCTTETGRITGELSLEDEKILEELHQGLDEQDTESIQDESTLSGPKQEDAFPEAVEAVVRDIIDGDTIDVDLDAVNAETGEALSLPEYKSTGHARIRLTGINAPEKSPKGEILCTDVEVYKVEKAFADEARDALLPLNDRAVILRIDPANAFDTHDRMLAMVEYQGENICLLQIKRGLACGYYRAENRYVDGELYSAATLEAREAGTGMWGIPAAAELSLYIDSVPSNARLYIDGKYTHHLTPSDEEELDDVMHMLPLGEHVFSAEKSGMSGELRAVITEGSNPDIIILLEADNVCVQEWVCSEWGGCINGTQGRTCTDEHACGSESNKPEESRSCQLPEEQANETENETTETPENSTVIISEIMYDSLSSYDQHGEFIELLNNGTHEVNLSGFVLSVSGKNDTLKPFNGSLCVLGPGERAVITGDNHEINATLPMHLSTGHAIIGSHGLSKDGENLTLLNKGGTVMDSLDYGELGACDAGFSLERKNNNWSCSAVENGTPGY